MTAKQFNLPEDFKKCAAFHGHICPGLSIGYKAAQTGLNLLKERRAADEEIVAVVENNACGVDAVQVLTGCTFGKGNFIFRDYGKQVFYFISRNTGRGVRLALHRDYLQFDSAAENEEYNRLRNKVTAADIAPPEKERFRELHHEKSLAILQTDAKQLFSIREVQIAAPPQAKIEKSIPCAACQEPVMASRLVARNNTQICRECMAAAQTAKKV
ncbi:MAG TPA: FmdE family protein [Spirochaetota bacterium]|nr:FmdE family protein [Spirochaetota bacterium]